MKTLKVNYLGSFTIEQCQKIRVKDLYEIVQQRIKEELINTEFQGIELIKTRPNYGGTRIWFKCPVCLNRSCILYRLPTKNNLCCRKCSGLKYKKQRYKGMMEENI